MSHSDWTRNLTFWQRVRRRLSLTFGSAYIHPDGGYELDFEAPAGIRRSDSDEVQQEKLASYERRKHERGIAWSRTVGAAVLGWAAYTTADHIPGASDGALGLGVMVALGLYLLSRR